MTQPKQWRPGDPITAARLNQTINEAMRSRREMSVGGGSTLVNEHLGNQSVNMPRTLLRLAIAINDFELPTVKTDLASALDDVPSGLCKFMRLDRKGGTHVEDNGTPPFLAYDVIGGLNNGVLKSKDEIFYVVYNIDSKRWEILQSASVKLTYGIPVACLGDGWYEVELSDWCGEPPAVESVSGSDETDCDLCSQSELDPEMDPTCATSSPIDVIRNVGNGTGEFVYAHTAGLIPLLTDGTGMVKMLKRSGCTDSTSTSTSTSVSLSASMSTSESESAGVPDLYDIVDAMRAIISLPFPEYECCEDALGNKTVVMTQCNHALVEGVWCEGEYIGCPPDSTSVSASSSASV